MLTSISVTLLSVKIWQLTTSCKSVSLLLQSRNEERGKRVQLLQRTCQEYLAPVNPLSGSSFLGCAHGVCWPQHCHLWKRVGKNICPSEVQWDHQLFPQVSEHKPHDSYRYSSPLTYMIWSADLLLLFIFLGYKICLSSLYKQVCKSESCSSRNPLKNAK